VVDPSGAGTDGRAAGGVVTPGLRASTRDAEGGIAGGNAAWRAGVSGDGEGLAVDGAIADGEATAAVAGDVLGRDPIGDAAAGGGIPREAAADVAGAAVGRDAIGDAGTGAGRIPREAEGRAGAAVGREAATGADVDGRDWRPGTMGATGPGTDGAAARAGAGVGAEGASIKINAATVAKPTTIATRP
jgi:hypothetical protein